MNILKTFDHIEKLELKLAEFYRFCHGRFTEDRDISGIFYQLSMEKSSHADLVNYQRRMVRKSRENFGEVSVDLDRMQWITGKIDEIVKSPDTPRLEDIIRLALEFESDALAYHHRTAIEYANPDVSRLVRCLGGSDSDHLTLLKALVARVGGDEGVLLSEAAKAALCVEGSEAGGTKPYAAGDEGMTRTERLDELAALRKRVRDLEKRPPAAIVATDSGDIEADPFYSSLAGATDDSVYIVDESCRYLFINQRHLNRLGQTLEEIRKKTYDDLHGEDEARVFREAVEEVFASGQPVMRENRGERDFGYYQRTFAPVKERGGNVVAVTVVSRNVTEVRRIEEALRILSLTDSLTGLYNRQGFVMLSKQYLSLAKRSGEISSLIYADLDGFRKINETFGRSEGDLVLIVTANILKVTFRASDIIARVGADEFAVFSVGSEISAEMIARLHNNLNMHNEQANAAYKLSLSIGVARSEPDVQDSIQGMLEKADTSRDDQTAHK